ncbi:MAG TPA: PspC domain-containing protein [Yinghuangia sp.]|nr:PspC domain-containing protein [Yinghuangia sp.]
MSDTTSPGSEAPPPQAPAHGGAPPLVRTVDDRVVAGVCGGLGRHFGVDPVIFRVVCTVLTLFGGLGVLLYGLGWLLMPADDHPTPLARDLTSGRNVAAAIPALAVAGIGTAVFFAYLDNGFDGAFPLLIVAGIILYVSHNRARVGPKTLGLEPWSLGGRQADTAQDTAAPGDEAARGPVSDPEPTPWWRRTPGPERPKPSAPQRRKARSYLAPATISLAAVAGGVMWWLDDATSADISVQVFLAVILAVLAGGLLAGTFFGGGRWLIAPALVFTALVSASAALTVPLVGPTGERTYRPGTVAAVESPYRLKYGELMVDLTELDFAGRAPADPVRIEATVGLGQLTIRIPDDVRVIVDADADLGSIDLQDRSDGGYKPERSTVITPAADRPPRGTIVLDLGVGMGNLEVKHGA